MIVISTFSREHSFYFYLETKFKIIQMTKSNCNCKYTITINDFIDEIKCQKSLKKSTWKEKSEIEIPFVRKNVFFLFRQRRFEGEKRELIEEVRLTKENKEKVEKYLFSNDGWLMGCGLWGRGYLGIWAGELIVSHCKLYGSTTRCQPNFYNLFLGIWNLF